MCDGYSEAYLISSVVLSAASAVAANDQQRHSANVQADAINANNASEHMDAQRASDQLAGATAEQMSDRALDARKQLARIQVINGEGGGGVTAGRLENESIFNAGQDQATIADNFNKQQGELAFGGAAAARNADAQMASIQQPSLMGTGLTIAGNALSAYGKWKNTQPVGAKGNPKTNGGYSDFISNYTPENYG